MLWLLQLPFGGFEPTPPSVKQIPRVASHSSADGVALEVVPRSPHPSPSDKIIRANDTSTSQKVDVTNNLTRSQEVTVKDTSRSQRRPLSDSTNTCHDNQHCLGQQPQLQAQRRLLQPHLARRRFSAVRLLSIYFLQYLAATVSWYGVIKYCPWPPRKLKDKKSWPWP